MPTAHKVLVKAGESALGRTSATATATSVVSTSASDGSTKGRWSEDEHKLFLQGLEQHGRKWKKIAAVVETRTKGQVHTHAQTYFAKLERLERSAKTKETDQLEVEDESRARSNSSTKQKSGGWSEDEHKLFLQGLEQHGRKWKKIAAVVGTRTRGQIQSHAQKYFAKLEKLESAKTKTKERNELMFFVVSWDERFQQLVEYKEQNGHCRVPRRYKDNQQLGDWVNNQRQRYKKNKLLPEQIKSLEGIGFVWILRGPTADKREEV